MDQISNPVAFASIPVELPQVPDPIHDAYVKKHRRKHKDRHGRSKAREKDGAKEDRERGHKRKDDVIRKWSFLVSDRSELTCWESAQGLTCRVPNRFA